MLELRHKAYTLYVEQGVPAPEIIETLGINKNTFTRWCRIGNWKYYRSLRDLAPSKLSQMYYDMCKNMAEQIRSQGGIPLQREANVLGKLTTAIGKLQKHKTEDRDLAIIMEFKRYVKEVSPDKMEIVKPLVLDFTRRRFKLDGTEK